MKKNAYEKTLINIIKIQKSKVKKNDNSKLKTQSSKPQLKTLKLSPCCHPEGSLSCHPEGAARRIPYQLAEGFFADAQNDGKKIKNQKSKIKDQKDNKSKLKAQNSKLQLKTLKLTFGHPERSPLSAAVSLFRNLSENKTAAEAAALLPFKEKDLVVQVQ